MEQYSLKFGGISESDPSLGIHKGRITLFDGDLRAIFDVVINRIIESCLSGIITQKAEVTQYSFFYQL